MLLVAYDMVATATARQRDRQPSTLMVRRRHRLFLTPGDDERVVAHLDWAR